MKKYVVVFGLIILFCSCAEKEKHSNANELNGVAVKDTSSILKPETFSYTEGDTTYTMQKYFMVFLKKGPNRSQDSITLQKLQQEHLAHLEKLHLAGKISIAGPFEDNSAIAGIAIYHTSTFKEADSLANEDPMVRVGRLVIETHPFWASKGSKLQ
ncbi:YciI family protein [Zhouia sp. PK063]|uniref:YciI family protein n=1 Tax=Zhouia sp. PK063 TaxID=3373602 RepID=UPI0037A68ACB